jgi:AcrR family transcriptional regulator
VTPRRGRRVAGGDTRAAILDAARTRFADTGYAATTLRALARDAGVDPALILHHFGSKEALFRVAMHFPIDPAAIAALIEDPERDELGMRLTLYFLDLWEREPTRASLLTMLRSALTHDAATEMLRGFITEALIRRVAAGLALPDAELRATLVGSQLVGLALARYLLRIEPLASADAATVARWVAPTLQRYLAR